MRIYNILIINALFSIIVFFLIGAPELNAQYSISKSALNVGNPGGIRTDYDHSTRNAQGVNYELIIDALYGGVANNIWSQAVSTPFPIEFGGNQFNQFCVSKNGLLTFSTQVAGSAVISSLNQNTVLPNPDLPDNTIAYFWDEFTEPQPNYGSYNNQIYMGYEGVAPNRQLWILNRQYTIGQAEGLYYALLFNENSPEFYIVDMNTWNAFVLSGTIGAQVNSTAASQVSSGLNSPAGSPDIVFGYLATNSHLADNNEYYIFQQVPYLAVDAGVTALDAPLTPAAPGLNNIEITLSNYGSANLTSAILKFRINNGPVSSMAWVGNIPPSSSLSNINIGSANLSPIINDIQVWVENPNGTTDSNPLNDTLLQRLSVCTPLSGNFTLGSDPTDDFSSFNDMVFGLTSCGVAGPVLIEIESGTYYEQIEIGTIPGASTTNTVTIKSETQNRNDVVLSHPANFTGENSNYVLRLYGTSYVSFEHITFERTGNNEEDYSSVVVLSDHPVHTSFSHCHFSGIQLSDNPWPMSNYLLYIGSSEYCTFDNNLFTGGHYGVRFEGNWVTTSKFNSFTNNTVLNCLNTYLNITYQENLTCTHNTIHNARVGYYLSFLGIFNQVHNNSVISHNAFIHEYKTSRYTVRLSGASSTNYSTFANNYIYGNAIQPSSYLGHTALEIQSSLDYYNIYHNTVVLEGILPDQESAALMIGTSIDFTNFRNNHLINRIAGQAVHFDRSNYNSLVSNFNNFYSAGPNPFRYDNTYYSTLAAYQAGTGRDGNSRFINPVFNGPIDFRLGTANLDNLGTPVPQVTDDFDGDPRDPVTPDIGADEFDTPAGNIAVLSIDPMTPVAGVQNIDINFKNTGSAIINNATFGFSVNGSVLAASNAYAGALAPGATTGPFTIDSYNFTDPINFIEAWPDLVNGTPDGFSGDDTARYVLAICSPLSGTYSIGGAAADFSDFAEALEALIYCGVGGPVVMEVNDGTYTEKLEIPPINGASSTNTITFISASNNSNNVTITSPASNNPNENFTVFLNGADYIRFEKMTLKRTGTNERYARIVVLGNEAHRNIIRDCQIIGFPVNTIDYSEDQALLYDIQGTIDNYNSIIGNTFLYGAQALVMYAININSTSNQLNTVISGNTISGQYGDAVFVQSVENLTFTYNHVLNSSPNLNNILVRLEKINKMQLTHNEIHKTGGRFRHGLSLLHCQGTSTNYMNIANNFISCEVTNFIESYTELFPISLDWVWYTNLNYNTANVYATGVGAASYSAVLRLNFTYYIKVRNNIMINQVPSSNPGWNANMVYDIYYVNLPNYNTYDYNVVYSTHGIFGEDQSFIATTFADWQSHGLDVHSSSFLPVFQSNTDLHTQDVRLFSVATPLAWVTDDIDGEPRDPVHPYAGADEYDNPTSSIAVLDILPLNSNPGFQNINIDFKNNGTQQITSASLNYSINGVPNAVPAAFAGALNSGAVQSGFSLGTYNFAPGSYIIKAYPESVNGFPDADPNDDTATYVLDVCAPLNGIYSIGGVSPDYADIQDAIDALESCGVVGPVVFNIESGIYQNQYDFGAVAGVSAVNTITFQSATGNYADVSVQFPAANFDNNVFTLAFDDVEWLIFKNISIKSIGTTEQFANVVLIKNNVNHIRFDACYFEGVYNTAGSTINRTLVVRKSSSTNCNDLSFINCIFKYGGMGLSLSGNSAVDLQTGLEISNCEFIDQYSSAISLKYQDAPVIHGNQISTVSALTTLEMMHIEECKNDFKITKNQLSKLNNAFNVGIYVKNCDGTVANKGLIANNFIAARRIDNGGAFGLYLDNSAHVNVFYNSINLVGETNYPSSRAFYLQGGSEVHVKNNSFVNNLGGYAYFLMGGGLSSSDHNNLYTNGPNLAYALSNQPRLADWQGVTSTDGNSVSQDAWYFSDDDLHTGSVFLANQGVSLPEVTVDIDDEIRGVAPDIGADEYTPFSLNVWISDIDPLLATGCPQDLTIDFINAGTTSLTSVEFEYSLNGTPSGSFIWSGNLASKQTIFDLTVGTLSLPLGAYHIQVYPKLLNGSSDEFARDDTVSLEINITHPIPDPPATTDAMVLFGSPTPDVSAAGTNVIWYSDNPPLSQIGVGNAFSSPETDIGVYTYYATQTDALGCESDPDSALLTIYDSDLIIWNGKVYINGSGPGGAPDLTDVAKDFHIMGTNGALSNDARVHSMKIYESTDLTVTSDFTLSVINEIENNGLLTVQNNGSLVQEDIVDNNFGTGTYRIMRDGILSEIQFQAWSSPIQAAQLMGPGGVFDGSNPCRTMVWNASSQRWKYDYVPNTVFDCGGGNVTFSNRFLMFDDPADNIMDAGRGYFIPGQNGAPTITFSGQINNGTFTKPVFETNSITPYTGDDWNLLGNPYPSALGIADWLSANSAMLSTVAVYLWDDDGSGGADYDEFDDYAVVNQFGFVGGQDGNGRFATAPVGIATAQGFFVEVNAIGNVTFSNAMRIAGNNDKFYKSSGIEEPAKFMVNLSSDQGSVKSTLVGFKDDATFGKDRLYDAPVLNPSGFEVIGTYLGQIPQAIQALPILEEQSEVEIPLYLHVIEPGTYNLSILPNEMAEPIQVYLRKPDQIAEIEMTQEGIPVHLQSNKNEGYSLVFRKGTILGNASIQNAFGWNLTQNPEHLFIEIIGNTHENIHIELVDLKGIVHRELPISNPVEVVSIQDLAAGVYLVHLTSETRDEVKRVVIR